MAKAAENKRNLPQVGLDRGELDQIISRYIGKPGSILGILEDAQKSNQHKYLTQDSLEYIAKRANIPLSRIYNIITFYAFFNLKPQGKHSIIVCRGTACHTRGSKNLLDFLINLFGFKEDDFSQDGKLYLTTKDNKFTIKTVACFGQCALAPVVEIDGNIYSRMTTQKLQKIIKSIALRGNKK
ncbi:MAG: NAD(P)H-dependent oxidoreductase subunit E [Candidatus Omnitrophica bacterium]|nr:NAD(P)H-dependent oxidoreductase subunit E [Candidatus Omnitrophota bacterium]MDD5661288.1 NAD(P)H-dependent oxidoreductase subunit E [Candidatus Omnitrophota bacterium]